MCLHIYKHTHARSVCVCTCVSLLPCLCVDVTPGARGIRRAARHTADTCSARPMTAWLSVVAAGCLIAQLCGGLWLLAAWSLSRWHDFKLLLLCAPQPSSPVGVPGWTSLPTIGIIRRGLSSPGDRLLPLGSSFLSEAC